MQTKLKPLGNRVLLEPVEIHETTVGGIVIPETADDLKPKEAVIVELGTGKTDDSGKKVPFEVKPGDHVLLSKYGGTDVELEDKTYKVLDSDDILAIIAEPRA
ncbi:MAG: co-chaperonin GroES [Pedosphaera sp.]|nr:co-chaperonin GroES [Pedosphaera sp.]